MNFSLQGKARMYLGLFSGTCKPGSQLLCWAVLQASPYDPHQLNTWFSNSETYYVQKLLSHSSKHAFLPILCVKLQMGELIEARRKKKTQNFWVETNTLKNFFKQHSHLKNKSILYICHLGVLFLIIHSSIRITYKLYDGDVKCTNHYDSFYSLRRKKMSIKFRN